MTTPLSKVYRVPILLSIVTIAGLLSALLGRWPLGPPLLDTAYRLAFFAGLPVVSINEGLKAVAR